MLVACGVGAFCRMRQSCFAIQDELHFSPWLTWPPQVLLFPWWRHRKEQFKDLFWR